MRIFRTSPAIVCLILLSVAFPRLARAQDDWPPIAPEELAMKDCPKQPGAPAIFLYREAKADHNWLTRTYFNRIKVLTPAGKERANVEIPFVKGSFKVEDLKARVVQPDGRAVDFHGQVFEKTAVRAGRMKTVVKAFALPDVEVGSIIDYRYQLVLDEGGASSKRTVDVLEGLLGVQGKPYEGGIDSDTAVLFFTVDIWDVQQDLFTSKAKFTYVPSSEMERYFARSGKWMQLNYWSQGLAGVAPRQDEGEIEHVFTDIPAFESEEFMPPESTLRKMVRFYYLEEDVGAVDVYWTREAKNWQKGLEKFMRKTGDAVAEAKRVTEGVDDPTAKLRALYGRAQEITNLSYDKTLTRRRREELKIKENKSVADVLKHGYGWRSDITRSFAAMARAAGFEVKVVRALMRDNKFFDKNLCGLYDQFDSELAMVKVDGVDKLFDPATPFCPMGLVRWCCTESVCLTPSDKPPLVLPTPPYPPDSALTQRELALALDLEGNLEGSARVVFLGQEALIRRVDHIGDDETQIREDFEADMAELLPAGAKVVLKKLANIDNNADNVVAEFEIFVPGLATPAGEKTLLPITPFMGARRHPFRHADRKNPVYFTYPYREFDDIVITLPEGLKVESIPEKRKKDLESFGFSLDCAAEDGRKLHAQRDLVVKKCYFTVDKYKAIKAFFDEVTAGDEELVVLAAEKAGKK
jgi:hypothetical protein